MSYTELELGKEVIHIQTKTLFGNFIKVVNINDIEII